MKKVLWIFILLIGCFMLNGCDANNSYCDKEHKNKILSTATIDQNFKDNEILVILCECVSFDNEKYNYTPESFSEIKCIEVKELGVWKNKVLLLTLKNNDKEYVLEAIKKLDKRNDVISATPNYIGQPGI